MLKLIPEPYRETAKLILAIALGTALLFLGQTIMGWYHASKQNDQRGQTMDAASGINKDGDASQEARQQADKGGAVARDTFQDTIEKDAQREPETAVRDTGVVPASRLRAFEQRRIERERLADDRLRRAGVKREERSRSADPPER